MRLFAAAHPPRAAREHLVRAMTEVRALTGTALVAYFLLAVGAHLRAHDYGRTLVVNAAGMLLLCATTTGYCFFR